MPPAGSTRPCRLRGSDIPFIARFSHVFSNGPAGETAMFILPSEPISKRFSLAEVKAGENFNRRNTRSISRLEI
jgi:hypothetical protein